LLVSGVDDAGRGSVLGPLVIAGVLVDTEDLSNLAELGVKDSKLVSPNKRKILYKEIKLIAKKIKVIKVSPIEIDKVVKFGVKLRRLNWLEAKTMALVLKELDAKIAYVDASDVLEERYKQHILQNLPFKINIISEHKADSKYTVVAAASIIAKVERDDEIVKLKKIYGDLGSGYPSDQKTVKFLKDCLINSKDFPKIVRKSWKTAKKAKEQHYKYTQKTTNHKNTLLDF